MRHQLWIAILVILLIVTTTAQATDYPLRHYTVANGLPSNEVYHVFQDSKGFIWMGTDNGVAKINGNEFIIYTIEDGLTDNTIFEIFEDINGKIWFTGFSGLLSVYDSNTIKPYIHNDVLKQLPTNQTIFEKNTIYVDGDGQVSFLGKSAGLKVISPEGELTTIDSSAINSSAGLFFVDFPWRPVVPINNVSFLKDIHLYPKGFSDYFQIISTDCYLYPPSARHWDNKYILHGNTFLYVADSTKLLSSREMEKTILYVCKPKNGQVWVGMRNGGAQLLELPSLNTIDSIKSLENHSVSSILEDAEGGIWFSTLTSGVFYLNPPELRLSKVNADIPDMAVKSLDYGPDSSIFIGYWRKNFSILSKDGVQHIDPQEEVNDNLIRFAHNPHNGYSYATSNRSIYSFDKNGENFKSFDHNTHILEYYYIEGEDILYGAAVEGLVEIGPHYYKRLYIDNSKKRIRTECIEYDKTKNIFWLGSIKGLFSFQRETNRYTEYPSEKTDLKINDILLKDNTLWIATNGNGLLRLKDGEIERFKITKNHSHDFVYQLISIGNDIWVNAGIHLIRIFKKDNIWVTQDYPLAHDQILGNINEIIEYNNEILLGTSNGLYTFDYKNIPKYEKNIPVIISRISINLRDTSVQKNYRLPYRDNNIKLYYTALTFFDPQKHIFKYRLKGLNDTWTTTTNRDVAFHNIPPGHYTFQLQYLSSLNEAIYFAEDINITIRKPYYYTWWFIFLTIVVPIGLLFLWQHQNLNRVRRENDFRMELLDARQKALINQINPHFIFNSLNSIQLYILNNDSKMSNLYLSNFARLIRISLDTSQQSKITLNKELELNNLYMNLEKMRFKNKFRYEVINNLDINTAKLQLPPFLIQPLLENALWHGLMSKQEKQGEIIVTLNHANDNLVVTITDNGIGMKAGKELRLKQNRSHKSVGISVSRHRLFLLSQQYEKDFSIHYKDLYHEDGSPAGTKITLILPYDVIKDKPSTQA